MTVAMADGIDSGQEARRRSMLPGSARDSLVSAAKWGFPIGSVLLFAVLLVLPVTRNREFSFLLSKDSAAHSGERMRIQEAEYRGETSRGEPFRVSAESGVQKTSAVPVVVLHGLTARIEQQQGPAVVTAPEGEFFLQKNLIVVNGPIVARSASGFSLDGERIEVDLNARRISTGQPVSGTLPMGEFRANAFTADIEGHEVSLTGGVNLRINPNRMKK